MYLTRRLFAPLAAFAALFLALPIRADLMGDTINASGIGLSPGSATVGAGIEFSGISDFIKFDFATDTLTVTTTDWTVGWWNYGNYAFTGFSDPILSVSILSQGGFSGTIVSNFSFTGDSITLDMYSGQASTWDSNLQGYLKDPLVFKINSATGTVPDSSATLVMLSGATISLVILRRRFVR